MFVLMKLGFPVQRAAWQRWLLVVAALLSTAADGENAPNLPDDDRIRRVLVGFWIGSEGDQDVATRDFATFTDDGRCMGRWEYGRPDATVSYYSGNFCVQGGVVEVSLVSERRKSKAAECVRFRVEIVSDDAFRRTDEGSGRVLNYKRRPRREAPPKLSPAIPVPTIPKTDSSVKPRLGG
jgi:hypothetical protein